MTIEPGEVIAVLAAATLLALEGLISQVMPFFFFLELGHLLSFSSPYDKIYLHQEEPDGYILFLVRGDHGGDGQCADCGAVLGGCLKV